MDNTFTDFGSSLSIHLCTRDLWFCNWVRKEGFLIGGQDQESRPQKREGMVWGFPPYRPLLCVWAPVVREVKALNWWNSLETWENCRQVNGAVQERLCQTLGSSRAASGSRCGTECGKKLFSLPLPRTYQYSDTLPLTGSKYHEAHAFVLSQHIKEVELGSHDLLSRGKLRHIFVLTSFPWETLSLSPFFSSSFIDIYLTYSTV